MDIICAKCGRHFNSIESAREHHGHCSAGSTGEEIHWLPAKKSRENKWVAKEKKEVTREELKKLNELAESIREKYRKRETEKTPPSLEESTIIQDENHIATIEEPVPESSHGISYSKREISENTKTVRTNFKFDLKKQLNFMIFSKYITK